MPFLIDAVFAQHWFLDACDRCRCTFTNLGSDVADKLKLKADALQHIMLHFLHRRTQAVVCVRMVLFVYFCV